MPELWYRSNNDKNTIAMYFPEARVWNYHQRVSINRKTGIECDVLDDKNTNNHHFAWDNKLPGDE